MNLDITQADAVEEITATVFDILDTKTTGMIDVDAVIRGDRQTGPTPDRTLWIFEDTAQCTENYGLTETWRLQIHLVAVTLAGSPQEAKRHATYTVSRAMSRVVLERRLGGLRYVQDVRKLRMMFTPPRAPQKKALAAVAGVIEVTFNIREKGE